MPALEQLTRADGTDAMLEVLARDGAVIIRDWVEPGRLERFRTDMVRHAAAVDAGTVADDASVRYFWGERTIRFTRLAHRSTEFVHLLTDPQYLELADRVLGPNGTDYWMNTGQMMIIGPGEKAQWLHRDADNWPSVCSPDGFEVTLSCMYAITEFTADVGATQVVPGSHLWEDYRRTPEPHEICQAVMPEGAGMVYTGRVIHGGGANVTADRFRYGLHLSYVLGWLTPEEAGPLGTSWEEVQHLPEQAQRLLGWRCSPSKGTAARLWTVDYEDVPVALARDPRA